MRKRWNSKPQTVHSTSETARKLTSTWKCCLTNWHPEIESGWSSQRTTSFSQGDLDILKFKVLRSLNIWSSGWNVQSGNQIMHSPVTEIASIESERLPLKEASRNHQTAPSLEAGCPITTLSLMPSFASLFVSLPPASNLPDSPVQGDTHPSNCRSLGGNQQEHLLN